MNILVRVIIFLYSILQTKCFALVYYCNASVYPPPLTAVGISKVVYANPIKNTYPYHNNKYVPCYKNDYSFILGKNRFIL